MSVRYLIGVDEVGRGCLAGPVVVGVVLIPRDLRLPYGALGPLRDSKRLTRKKRENWARYLVEDKRIHFALARVNPRVIERINISNAANRAALRAYRRLLLSAEIEPKECRISLDGGLYLGRKNLISRAKTIIGGDAKHREVMCASILAKVHRDSLMRRLAKRYPAYGFDLHKGYATPYHLEALKKSGPSDMHRLTFLGKTHIIGKK